MRNRGQIIKYYLELIGLYALLILFILGGFMLELFIILLCWVVQMPLWCSIVGTVICSLHLILSVVSDVINITGRD